VQWLYSSLLAKLPNVGHAFLTREGGFSKEPFDHLNLSLWTEDDASVVQKNLASVQKELSLDHLHFLHQVHGITILCADGANHALLGEADGLWTRESGRGVMVLHADCQPILIADPIREVVCAVHAGWRGVMQGVLPNALAELQRIGSQPEHCWIAIGPSLGPLSAEFIHYRTEFPEWAWKYRREDDLFNLWEISQDQALQHGIPKHQIDILGIDTLQDQRFFSFRRFPRTGRNGSVIWLR
jgi:polyphenol oxidase